MRVPSSVWKALGVAGVAGVAATGVVVVRDQRRRRQLTPDQIRKQLHQRVAELEHGAPGAAAPATAGVQPRLPVKEQRRRRRR